MLITPIKTRILVPPKDNLLKAIQEAVPQIPEHSILAITSKVVSIHEGRCVSKDKVPQEDTLVIQEAELYIPRGTLKGRNVIHTLAHNMVIPSVGIDTLHDYHVLWPRNPQKSAHNLWKWIKKIYKLRNVGVLITDSHSIPLRRGTIGISLSYYGFQPLHEYQGERSLFGYDLGTGKVANMADGLAAAATLAIGEGAEQTPIAIITNVPGITLSTRKNKTSFHVPLKDDIYWPLLKDLPWKKGRG